MAKNTLLQPSKSSNNASISLLVEAQQVISNRHTFLSNIGGQKYIYQEQILNNLFTNASTHLNTNFVDVYHKVSLLNLFTSTQIKDILPIVSNIMTHHNIDNDMQKGQISVVTQIANFTPRYNLSFASKYCFWHNAKAFPIYDFIVRDYLARVIKKGNLNNYSGNITYWRDKQFKNYACYVSAYNAFRLQYNLSSLTYREIDCYIWTAYKCNLAYLNLFKLI